MSHTTAKHDPQSDEALAQEIVRATAVLQQAIHRAVEAGLKVGVAVESMHEVGRNYPEPMIGIEVERVIKLG